MKKITKALALTFATLLSISAVPAHQVSATESQYIEIDGFWQNTSSVTASVNRQSGTVTASVNAFSGTTSITATVRLQRQVGNTWTTVQTWSNLSSSRTTLAFSESVSLTSGTYRATITANVTRNGVTETVTN